MTQHANEEAAIRNLQTYLRQLSYHDDRITSPPIDGIFDNDTQKALTEFQRAQGLPQTGIADQAAWELLYILYRASLAEHTTPQRLDLFPALPANMEYGPGAKNFTVAAIQFMLRELEAKYGAVGMLTVTGEYDEPTTQAVQAFQRQNALQPSGLVDRVTWNELVDQHNILFGRFGKE